MGNRSFIILISFIAAFGVSFATEVQELDSGKLEEKSSSPLSLGFTARFDYQREYYGSQCNADECGFKGKYFVFDITGNITDKISYFYYQELNQLGDGNDFFDSMDQLKLQYRFNRKWDITGGKMGIGFGSYEYDKNPYEIYVSSEFNEQIDCYKFGLEIGYNVTENDRLIFQFTESPFKKKGKDLYGYNFSWFGNHSLLSTIYSAHMLEYDEGKYIYYLCLAHRLDFGKFGLDLDYVNRATGNHAFFFKDCSLVCVLSYQPADHWNLYAKGVYERNVTDDSGDECIVSGTDIGMFGAGLEFYPLKNDKSLRIHAAYGYSFGQNGSEGGLLQDKRHFMTIGVQWRIDIVKIASDLWSKIRKDK